MKNVIDFYSEFEAILKKENSPFLIDFTKYTKSHTPKEVFYWLNDRSTKKELSEKLETVLTEFFYSLR